MQVVGIYATGNDFGDNHVFVPLETFRCIYKPGDKIIRIRDGRLLSASVAPPKLQRA